MGYKQAVLAKRPKSELRKRQIAPLLGPHYEYAVFDGEEILSLDTRHTGGAQDAWRRAERLPCRAGPSMNKPLDPREQLAVVKEAEQPSLFSSAEAPPAWASEWQGMPEFVMGDARPFQRIVVNFKTAEDVKAFADLIGQRLTRQTDSVWFPKPSGYIAPKSLRYVDGDES